jgi:hypothetical protein
MKTTPFILCALILGTLILAGCGEWRAKRKAERDDAKKQGKHQTNHAKAKTPCNENLKVTDITSVEMLESGAIRYHIDTNKVDDKVINPENILTCYKYLWKLEQYDSIVMKGSNNHVNINTRKIDYIYHFYGLYYKGIKLDNEIRIVKSTTNKIYQIQFMNYLAAPIDVSLDHIISPEEAESIGVNAKAKTHTIYWLYAKECFQKGTCGQDYLDGYKPDTKLIIRSIDGRENNKLFLVYKVYGIWLEGPSEEDYAKNAIEIWSFFIDAHSGKIIKEAETSYD